MGYKDLKFPKESVFLVTGGAGFIGSNLCEAILNLGYRVRCLDNFSSGKGENLKGFNSDSKFYLIEGDIKDFETCKSACKGVDFVLHQAASSSVPQSIEEPFEYCANNICGTLNMLEAARVAGIKKFVYASSASVYGNSSRALMKEGEEDKRLSPYAVTKYANEEWARQYYLHYGLPTYGLRYFNVFGRRQDPEGQYAAVIPKFIKQLLKGEKVVIYGDGLQTRDFTYVENVIEANLKAISTSHDGGVALNIACGKSEKLIDVYYEIANALNPGERKDVPLPVFASERIGDIKYSAADISSAREILGYRPEWTFKKGIYESLEWYKNYFTLRGN